MKIDEKVSLSQYSTMGLGGPAAHLCTATNRDDLVEALNWAKQANLPVIIIGEGSNIVWRDSGFNGLVIANGIRQFELREEDGKVYLTAGAGEIWDEVVERSVAAGLSGIEALSLIPGTVGATPVQNVGAYGQDVSQTLSNIEAYDTQTAQFVNLSPAECGFSYRASRFNGEDRGRFFIVSLTFKLKKANPEPPFYASVQKYFDEHEINHPTSGDLRTAVIVIRRAKLPDPKLVRNCGSFFGNPMISHEQYRQLQTQYPEIPGWNSDEGVKIPAAWLIEQAGFKNVHDAQTGMATWEHQPLVLVNESAKSTGDLLTFKQKIIESVQTKFNITLKQEPELLP